MVEYLMLFMGTLYGYGGDMPFVSLDCSGLICEGLRAYGVIRYNEDLTSQGIYNRLSKRDGSISVRYTNIRANDILFFGGLHSRIIHISIAKNSWQMLEAGGGDSTTITEADAINKDAFVRIRPISNRKEFP